MTTRRCLVLWLFLTVVLSGCGRDNPKEPETARDPLPAPARSATVETPRIRFIERITGAPSNDANEKLPLVIAIHGLGDNPESFLRIFDGFSAHARLVLPYGLEPSGNGFSWFPISRMDPRVLADGTERASRALAILIEELMRTRPTQGQPIVTGFSQGGMLSFTLAVLFPERVGEAFPVAGLLAPPLYPSSWPMGKLMPPIHALHGDADTLVPTQSGRETVKTLVALGFTADLKEYPGVGHTVSAAMRRDLLTLLAEAVARQSR